MNLIISVDEEVFEGAFAAARSIGVKNISRAQGLPAPVVDVVNRWVEHVWDNIEQALRDSYEHGRAAAQSAIEAVGTAINEAASEIGEKIVEVEAILRRRLDAYFDELVNAALARVRATISIGNRELVANGATIQQTIRFTGSVKAKLDDLCSFVAESQLAVSVEYGIKEA